MSEIDPIKNDPSALRKKAEEKLASKGIKRSKSTALEMEHDLNVHKVELEMQNDELRATDLKLKQSSDEFTQLFDRAPIAYFILDKDGVIKNLNTKACNLLSETKSQLIEKTFSVYIDGESEQDNYYRYRNLVIETGISNQVESQIRKKDGSICHVLIETSVINDEDNNFKHMLSAITDISALKNTEDLLGKNQLLLQNIYNNTSTVILLRDLEGRYVMVNKQFEKIHNITSDNIIGKTVYDVLPKELADTIYANDNKTLESKKISEREETILHRSDGSLHTYHSVKFPVVDRNNNIYLICTIATDLTEKKKHEEEIFESKARLVGLLENSISTIWSIDRDYKLIAFNTLCEKTLKKLYNISIHPGISMLEHLSFEKQNEWKMHYDKAFTGEHFLIELNEKIWNKDFYFDVSFNPIWLNDKVTGVSVFVRDITDRKKTEQQLQYKMNELNMFIYKATHDLRSPLASLLGIIKLAKGIADQPELKQYFEMIDTSVSRMDRLLIDLVSIVSVSQGKLNVTVIDFENIVDEIIESLSNRPKFSEIIIKKKIKTETLFFQSDARLIYSILQNIIDNSIKYRNEISTADSIIIIDIYVNKDIAKINITDNGIGIPFELKDKVFDMFYRATTKSTGTGLGLYIVKGTVEKLGGEISLQSELNSGTAFFINLPNIKE